MDNDHVDLPSLEEVGRATPPSPVLPVVPRTRRAGTGTSGNLVLLLAGFIAIGGLAFAAGRFTAPPTASATSSNGSGNAATNGNGTGTTGTGRSGFGNGAFGGGGFGRLGGGGGLTLRGTVSAVTATSLTLTLSTGQTVTIPLDTSTTYHQETAGSASDVAVGKSVVVQLGSIQQPNASPGAAAGGAEASPRTRTFSFGPAKDVTVVPQ